MRRYLVVAHRTLGGEHLLDHVRSLRDGGPCRFFLLVPQHHPMGTFAEADVEQEARHRLQEGLDRFNDIGVIADGEVGDVNPVYAVSTLLRRDPEFDEIILSTLPAGPSRWLRLDVLTRLRKEVDLPVTHLVAERESVA